MLRLERLLFPWEEQQSQSDATSLKAAKPRPCVVENIVPNVLGRIQKSLCHFLSPHLLFCDERQFEPHADTLFLGPALS